MPRKSARENKGKLPSSFNDFEMGDTDEPNANSTLREMTESEKMQKLMDKMSQQIEQMSMELNNEREERKRLAELVDLQGQSTSQTQQNVQPNKSTPIQEHTLANPNLIEDLANKLPLSRRLDWGMHSMKIKPYVTIRHFSDWLTDLAHIVSLMSLPEESEGTSDRGATKKKTKSLHHTTSSTPAKPLVCGFCKGGHRIVDCNDFKYKSTNERWEVVKSQRLPVPVALNVHVELTTARRLITIYFMKNAVLIMK